MRTNPWKLVPVGRRPAKVLQSWNKVNLFNLRHARPPPTRTRTFFQQKWTAKSVSRTYHGEQVRESQWEKMFSRRVRSVVPMDAAYMARNDGSVESAGRGSGLALERKAIPSTPHMQMTFAPLERRLDVAIFRAMFASSTRQARQFVIHGSVTMRYPGYLLNPGDMFQVDPERVMFATGAPKDPKQRRIARRLRNRTSAKAADEEPVEEKESGEAEEAEAESAEGEAEEGAKPVEGQPKKSLSAEDARELLKTLLTEAKEITKKITKDEDIPVVAAQRANLNKFRQGVRRALASASSGTNAVNDLEAQFAQLKILAKTEPPSTPEEETSSSSTGTTAPSPEPQPSTASSAHLPESVLPTSKPTPQTISKPSKPEKADPALKAALQKSTGDPSTPLEEAHPGISDEDLAILRQALTQMHENPIDSTKPYGTPWRPRDYMSPFAFIPRYLEVNQNICAAVYLRHPVARPGLAEVPSPYPEAVNGAAFTWYLRRR
ncbi:mitochondrial 37S ribosomal protein nam9 [Onygenales sp. PD_10]|nr:mitochondrial 37S ribosomal protein nam9 [Onygenales sp. PD_10]